MHFYNIELLKLSHINGAYLSINTLQIAVDNKHPECIKYLCDNNCEICHIIVPFAKLQNKSSPECLELVSKYLDVKISNN